MDLNEKVINFLGDSITEGCGVSDIENNRYDKIVHRHFKLKNSNNYGIGGTRIAYQSKSSDIENPQYDLYFCGRARLMSPDADVIVVFGGTNDYGHGDAPFGTPEDTTPNTFFGAVDFLMTDLKKTYPNAKIIFMTPAHRVGDELPSMHHDKKKDAKPLKDYAEVIKLKGKEHNVGVLDLYEKLNINPNAAEDRDKYTVDGLHFNDEGHSLIAKCLIEYLIDIQ